jgi:NTE family protein
VRGDIFRFLEELPAALQDSPVAKRLRSIACPRRMDIVHLIYRSAEQEGSSKDFQFARAIIEQRWEKGRDDARATMLAAPWNAIPTNDEPVRVFDVLGQA